VNPTRASALVDEDSGELSPLTHRAHTLMPGMQSLVIFARATALRPLAGIARTGTLRGGTTAAPALNAGLASSAVGPGRQTKTLNPIHRSHCSPVLTGSGAAGRGWRGAGEGFGGRYRHVVRREGGRWVVLSLQAAARLVVGRRFASRNEGCQTRVDDVYRRCLRVPSARGGAWRTAWTPS